MEAADPEVHDPGGDAFAVVLGSRRRGHGGIPTRHRSARNVAIRTPAFSGDSLALGTEPFKPGPLP
jgi:hypothetical protein